MEPIAVRYCPDLANPEFFKFTTFQSFSNDRSRINHLLVVTHKPGIALAQSSGKHLTWIL